MNEKSVLRQDTSTLRVNVVKSAGFPHLSHSSHWAGVPSEHSDHVPGSHPSHGVSPWGAKDQEARR